MSMIQQSGGNTLAVPTRNAFEQYAEDANRNRIIGELLKFNRGEWLYGRNSDDMALGTQMVANMDGLLVGWTRWEANKPVENRVGLVLEGYQPPRRAELGFTDEGDWEVDQEGKKKDPWQFGNTLILKAEKGDQLYTFNANSKGSLGMIGKLCGVYGKTMRQKPSEYPIIALDRSFYIHPVYKKTWTPEMRVVGWADKAGVAAAIDGEAAENAANEQADAERDEPAAAAPEKKTPSGKTRF